VLQTNQQILTVAGGKYLL
jgi:hypothetical protein